MSSFLDLVCQKPHCKLNLDKDDILGVQPEKACSNNVLIVHLSTLLEYSD